MINRKKNPGPDGEFGIEKRQTLQSVNDGLPMVYFRKKTAKTEELVDESGGVFPTGLSEVYKADVFFGGKQRVVKPEVSR